MDDGSKVFKDDEALTLILVVIILVIGIAILVGGIAFLQLSHKIRGGKPSYKDKFR